MTQAHSQRQTPRWILRFTFLLVILLVSHAALTLAPATAAHHIDHHAVTIQQCDAADGVVNTLPVLPGGPTALHLTTGIAIAACSDLVVVPGEYVFAADGATTRAMLQVFLN